VIGAADPVADQGADDREAGAFHDQLDGMRDVTHAVARASLVDAGRESLLADLEQPLGLGVDLADPKGVGAVCNQSVERHPDVDGDEVALLDAMVSGDAVDDHRIRRDARRRRKAAVALGRRNAALLANEVLGNPVELAGSDTGLGVLAEERDGGGDDLPGALHAFDLAC